VHPRLSPLTPADFFNVTMRIPSQPAPLLLLLLPALHAFANSLPSEVDKNVARALPVADYPAASPLSEQSVKATKDAPVDGLDGKPHEGPYVDGKPSIPKKLAGGIEELRPGAERITPKKLTEEELAALGPENDGVMDDPDRVAPVGVTGTEGGVSAKEKDRLAHESKTGEKLEKIPEQPKEAPPLPHAEQERLNPSPPTETNTKKLGAQGLEVCHYRRWHSAPANTFFRNLMICLIPHTISHTLSPLPFPRTTSTSNHLISMIPTTSLMMRMRLVSSNHSTRSSCPSP